METIGDRIKALRGEGRPQQWLAEEIGVTYQAVSQWENNHTAPKADKLPALRRVFKVPYEYLIDGHSPTIESIFPDLDEAELAAVQGMVDAFRQRKIPPNLKRRLTRT